MSHLQRFVRLKDHFAILSSHNHWVKDTADSGYTSGQIDLFFCFTKIVFHFHTFVCRVLNSDLFFLNSILSRKKFSKNSLRNDLAAYSKLGAELNFSLLIDDHETDHCTH